MERVPVSLLLEQGPMLKSFAGVIGRELVPFTIASENPDSFADITAELATPSERLISHYMEWAGCDKGRYSASIPTHIFFQLAMPLCIKQLAQSRYRLSKVINQGCRMTVIKPVPWETPVMAKVSVTSVREVPGKARVSQTISIYYDDELAAELQVQTLFPLSIASKRRNKLPETQASYSVIGHWSSNDHDGRDFALLSGDFNPIHWSRWVGKMSPFGTRVLHGMGTFIRSIEVLQNNLQANIRDIDARFTAPLKLPGGVNTLLHQLDSTAANQQQVPLRLEDENGRLLMLGSYQL
ncbi:hypothetical protein GCM10011369_14840 [Neiella marina]|uniref:MaoC-like domain-containing protein n=1 Tax=Neiella marina TaxID=508461 RepID=A0A8J2U4G8_9GAMM|nr:MaoC/PaaZ C-terminal domain-containing protein [Neiella marina]GGA74025.1 hypothetical protein GCM10011369_14840 [Neiella marina]